MSSIADEVFGFINRRPPMDDVSIGERIAQAEKEDWGHCEAFDLPDISPLECGHLRIIAKQSCCPCRRVRGD